MSKAETLFDALQMAVHSKGSPYAYMTSTLRRARCFVLDESMSSFLAVLATAAFHELTKGHNMQFVRDEDGSSGVAVSGSAGEVAQVTKKICNVVEGLRVLAKAPHAVTWIEFDFGKRFERYMKAFSAYGEKAEEFNKNRRASFQLCGWLIEQCSDEVYSCVCVMGDGKEQIEITPYAYVWTTGATRPSISGGFQFASPEDSDQFENTHERIASRLAFGTPAAEGSCQFGPTPVSRLVPIEMVTQVMQEMRGELRYVWALLASINDLPVGIAPVTRSRGFMARRNYQRFMSYSVITLHLPKRASEKKLARMLVAISRRKAHEVRGHFKRVGKDKVRKWIKEHVRGDASLGWVTHSYIVKHETENANG